MILGQIADFFMLGGVNPNSAKQNSAKNRIFMVQKRFVALFHTFLPLLWSKTLVAVGQNKLFRKQLDFKNSAKNSGNLDQPFRIYGFF